MHIYQLALPYNLQRSKSTGIPVWRLRVSYKGHGSHDWTAEGLCQARDWGQAMKAFSVPRGL